ncbi:MAG TPA: hypothetical protein VFK45_05560 [Gammaproteobacteria bacterium]|nr:hypothetical protein [Gammaproteobacteria bacterium]
MDEHNRLLAALPRDAYDKIRPNLKRLSLPREKLLHPKRAPSA